MNNAFDPDWAELALVHAKTANRVGDVITKLNDYEQSYHIMVVRAVIAAYEQQREATAEVDSS